MGSTESVPILPYKRDNLKCRVTRNDYFRCEKCHKLSNGCGCSPENVCYECQHNDEFGAVYHYVDPTMPYSYECKGCGILTYPCVCGDLGSFCHDCYLKTFRYKPQPYYANRSMTFWIKLKYNKSDQPWQNSLLSHLM